MVARENKGFRRYTAYCWLPTFILAYQIWICSNTWWPEHFQEIYPFPDARDECWLVSASCGHSVLTERGVSREGPQGQFWPVRPERCLSGNSGKSTTPLKSHSGKGLFRTIMKVYPSSCSDSLITLRDRNYKVYSLFCLASFAQQFILENKSQKGTKHVGPWGWRWASDLLIPVAVIITHDMSNTFSLLI